MTTAPIHSVKTLFLETRTSPGTRSELSRYLLGKSLINEAAAQTQQMEKMSFIGMKDLDQGYDLAFQDWQTMGITQPLEMDLGIITEMMWNVSTEQDWKLGERNFNPHNIRPSGKNGWQGKAQLPISSQLSTKLSLGRPWKSQKLKHSRKWNCSFGPPAAWSGQAGGQPHPGYRVGRAPYNIISSLNIY